MLARLLGKKYSQTIKIRLVNIVLLGVVLQSKSDRIGYGQGFIKVESLNGIHIKIA